MSTNHCSSCRRFYVKKAILAFLNSFLRREGGGREERGRERNIGEREEGKKEEKEREREGREINKEKEVAGLGTYRAARPFS